MPELIKKCKFIIDNWDFKIAMPYSIKGVRYMKVRLLSYTTASSGGRDLTIRLRQFQQHQQGLFIKSDRANDQYLFMMPIDSSAVVTNLYTNYLNEYDLKSDTPLPEINEIHLECLINDVPTADITPANPVTIEIGFYM